MTTIPKPQPGVARRNEAAELPPERQVYCNRTLNLRSIRAIGYDMDYTLVHYKVAVWEDRAYTYLKQKLLELGWPVDHLQFDPTSVIRGLILDTELGNTLKVNRFGYVKQAFHGTRRLARDEQRQTYSRLVIELEEPRYVFLNTLFAVSEASMYGQMVDLLDEGKLPGRMGYGDLYRRVRSSINDAHLEGHLKGEIIADFDSFVELDPEIPLALLDQKHAGKRLILITNSDWSYTRSIMSYAFDGFLPGDMTWRDLFDIMIVSARKPDFFSASSPVFKIVNEEGLLEPCIKGIDGKGIYFGGNASHVEEYLQLSGDEILYVGDHIFTDVHVTKNMLRWRTALVLRELESDLAGLVRFEPQHQQLTKLMAAKEDLETELYRLRLDAQRKRVGYGPQPQASAKDIESRISTLRGEIAKLDEAISPIAQASGSIGNERWGPLMRAGNDKSHLARQVERYADIYMSRVSNFVSLTPFKYLRASRGSLPHDPEPIPVSTQDEGEGSA